MDATSHYTYQDAARTQTRSPVAHAFAPRAVVNWRITPRETQVLELVAGGMSAKETAQRLDMAPRTVDQHIVNLKMKTRARNRAHMITIAIVENLIDVRGLDMAEAA